MWPEYTANASLSRRIGYGYDAASNRTLIVWPETGSAAFEARYAYDAANRLTEVRAGVPSTVATTPQVLAGMTYDSLSRRTAMTRGNGANTTFVREPDDDLAEVTHGFASGSVTSAPFTYVTNPSGQIGSMTVGAAAFQWLAPASYARTYGAPNALNQLASEAGKPITWETLSGLNTGNMASASLDGSATITTFAHDGMNRLTAASRSGMAAAYAYDADDRRTRKTVTLASTVVTETLWSGTDEIADYDGAGAVLRRVIPGAGIEELLSPRGEGVIREPRMTGGVYTRSRGEAL